MHFKRIGKYNIATRYKKVKKFKEKKLKRIFSKKVSYGIRKVVADKRLRIKGRFIRKQD